MWVHLKPVVNGLKEPLKFHWYFGDGQESMAMVPKPHHYESGRYDVILEVTDKAGKTFTAGIDIDAAYPG